MGDVLVRGRLLRLYVRGRGHWPETSIGPFGPESQPKGLAGQPLSATSKITITLLADMLGLPPHSHWPLKRALSPALTVGNRSVGQRLLEGYHSQPCTVLAPLPTPSPTVLNPRHPSCRAGGNRFGNTRSNQATATEYGRQGRGRGLDGSLLQTWSPLTG